MAYSAVQAARIADGLCKDCGSKRGETGTTVFCRQCADRNAKRASARKERLRQQWSSDPSACADCGARKDREDRTRCAECRKRAAEYYANYSKARRAKRKQDGTCRTCNEQRFHQSLSCRFHWALDICRVSGVGREMVGQVLAKLEEQRFTCYYTGLPLTPGANASIDHRIPVSRGGSRSDIDNCVWADRNINAFKNSLTEEEFIERCRKVIEIRG